MRGQILRGPRRSTVHPLRSPQAPAQTTLQKSRGLVQRLQTPRQTAKPSARPEQSWPLALVSMLVNTNHQSLTAQLTPPFFFFPLPGEFAARCADLLLSFLSLHGVTTMSQITTTAATTKSYHLDVFPSCIVSELLLVKEKPIVKR